jgi:hypothetical protein
MPKKYDYSLITCTCNGELSMSNQSTYNRDKCHKSQDKYIINDE